MRTRIALYCCCLILICCNCCRRNVAPVSEFALSDKSAQARILRGFYPAEAADSPWRWTSRVFAVSLDRPPLGRETYIELQGSVPVELLDDVGSVTMIATVNGTEVGRQTYYAPGSFTFTRYVPERGLEKKPAEVEFELDRSTVRNDRLIGVIALSVGLKDYHWTIEYHQTQAWLARQGYQRAVDQRRLALPPEKELELRKLFTALPVWKDLKFQNLPVHQNPLDLWMIQQIIYEVQPDFIVTTGAGSEGFVLYLGQTLDGLKLERARILKVSLQDPTLQVSTHFLGRKYIQFLHEDPKDPATAAAIAAKIKGRKTMVVLDSDHTAEHVLQELRLYGAMVSPASYLILQNTRLDAAPGQPESGTYEALRQFLRGDEIGKLFEPDPSREALIFTLNAGGWLRRK